MFIGFFRDGMGRSGLHHLISELGAWFVGAVEQWNNIAAGQIAIQQLVICEWFTSASF